MIKKIKAMILLVVLSIMLGNYQGTYALADTQGTKETDPITISANKSKTDYLSKESAARWFKVNVKKEGILTITLNSKELKQNGMLYLYYGETIGIETKDQAVRLEYVETEKTQTATLVSDTALTPGNYLICFRTGADTLEESVKYTLKTSLKSTDYDDKEPNSTAETAQELTVKDISKEVEVLNMSLNSKDIDPDVVDRFRFTLKSKKGLVVKVKSKGEGTLRVLLYKGDDTKVLNTKEAKQYLEPNGKTKELVYTTTKAQAKGDYSVAVILQDIEPCTMDYSISVSYYEPVKSIQTSDMKVTKGKEKKISLEMTPEKATETFTYKSSDTKIATVDENGVVKGIKKGTATITIKSEFTKKTAKCKVTVEEQKVEKITLLEKEKVVKAKILTEGESFKIKAKVAPNNATNKAVSFSSSDKKVATVDKNGKVKGIKKGTATITVTAKDGGKAKATCKITVEEQKVEKITLSRTEKTLTKGESFRLKVEKITPDDAVNKAVSFSSSDKKVATVDKEGKVKAIKEGTATITVKAKDGGEAKATCKVTVKKQRVERIALSRTSRTMDKGDSFTLGVTIYPKDAENKRVSFSSSNRSVATVSDEGRVRAVGSGTATITVKAKDGSGERAYCRITVRTPTPEPKPVETPQPTIDGPNNVKVSSSITLRASHSGGSWSASNGNVSISSNGTQCTVRGVSEGNVRVTYTLNGKSAGLSIYVKK